MFFSNNHSHVSNACDGTRAVEGGHDGEEGRAERDMTETKKDMVVEVRRSGETVNTRTTPARPDRRNRQTRQTSRAAAAAAAATAAAASAAEAAAAAVAAAAICCLLCVIAAN